MADGRIECPMCPKDIECPHDQDDRRALCRELDKVPVLEPDVYVSTDPAQVNKKANTKRNAENQAKADLLAVMKLPEGRRFMARLLTGCGVEKRSFEPHNPDPYTAIWQDGHRDVGLSLIGLLARACPEEYQRMRNEIVKEMADG